MSAGESRGLLKRRVGLHGLAAAVLILGHAAYAEVSTGPGGRGVTVGRSSLISTLDYSDTFTGTDDGGRPNRPYMAAVQAQGAYMIENTYANPSQQFTQVRTDTGVVPPRPNFSFAADRTGTPGLLPTAASPYPGSSGAGSDLGFTQTGNPGLDYGINYGLRNHYVVQVDAVQVPDRIDITSGPIAGTIFQENSLSVFFRGQNTNDPNPALPNNISLFTRVIDPVTGNPVNRDVPVRGQPGYENFGTGLAGSREWHNYAVRFDQSNKLIEVFVDEVSLGTIDLTTFDNGTFANFSNAAVSAGSGDGAGDRTWTDNFQVGAAVPEPGALALVAMPLLTLSRRRGRRA
jgi:hypothetical protein